MPEEVRLRELLTQKDKRIRELEADKQRQAQEINLMKEKIEAAAVKSDTERFEVVEHRESGDLLRLCPGQFYVDTLSLELI